MAETAYAKASRAPWQSQDSGSVRSDVSWPTNWITDTEQRKSSLRLPIVFISALFVLLLVTASLFFDLFADFTSATASETDPIIESSSSVPDYYRTSPELYAGPTRTADIAPFLAQTNEAPFGTASFVPNSPLETAIPIVGNTNNSNIFQKMGQLSPYFPNPDGFGVNEFHLPPGANLTAAHLLSRHGSRYPTNGNSVATFGAKIRNVTVNGTATWAGELAFLNDWFYTLGAAILVPRGRQELFDSGILFYYNYGHLYNTSTKIIARTTTQDRMLKSAEYFMAGFFGLEWTQNVSLVPIIEQPNFNNSLAGYLQCNQTSNPSLSLGSKAVHYWQQIYLANATARLGHLSGGYDWTIADSYNAQALCPYETVAYGYSKWCDLFTYDEWLGFGYTADLAFQGNDGFMSPVGRAIGIGYVEELYARLRGQLYNLPPGATQDNITLDSNEATFPINQSLYMDFTHDTNIYSILTAVGLRQFADQLSNSSITPNRNVTISHITPFAARVVWEQITAPHPLKVTRPSGSSRDFADHYMDGGETQYIHMTISQRTVPLGFSYPECGMRDDGWCEMGTFLSVLDRLLDEAEYEFACFGNYTVGDWGSVTDGVPVVERKRGAKKEFKERTLLRRVFGSGLIRSRNSDLWAE